MGAFSAAPQQNPLLGILSALGGGFNPQQAAPQAPNAQQLIQQLGGLGAHNALSAMASPGGSGDLGPVGTSGMFGVGNPVFSRFYQALTQQLGGTAPTVGQAVDPNALMEARRALLSGGDEEAAFGIFGGNFGDETDFLGAARGGRDALRSFLAPPQARSLPGGLSPQPAFAPVSTARQQQPLATTLGQPAPETRALGGASGGAMPPIGFPLGKRNPFGSLF